MITNHRSKKKKEIRYDESLRRVLENTCYSHLYNMLLDAHQMKYLKKKVLKKVKSIQEFQKAKLI
jgi:hypothetical protein